MVSSLYPCFSKEMVYTIAFLGSVTLGSGGRTREEGCHGGVVQLFCPMSEKSTLWTNASLDQNFQRDLRAVGPYGFKVNSYG